MITQLRLAVRLQQFEVIASLIAAAAVATAALVIRYRLEAVGVPAECWSAYFASSGGSEACAGLVQEYAIVNGDEADKVMAAMAFLPLAIGLVLGAPLVAREIEGATASTVWALSASRERWLASRLIPMIVVVVALLGVAAVAVEILWLARDPWKPSVRWDDAGLHGPVVLAMGVASFSVALLCGAVLGRVLPAVIVGAALAGVLLVGHRYIMNEWLDSEAQRHLFPIQLAALDDDRPDLPGGTNTTFRWRSPDGPLLLDEEAISRVPSDAGDWQAWLLANGYEPVLVGVPADVYPTWAGLETGGLGIVGVVAIAATIAIVNRRRPLH
jgi:hypothetical protein